MKTAKFFGHPKPHLTNYICNWSRRLNIIYVECPKVACTTIKRVLQHAEVNGDLSQISKNVHDRNKSPLAKPGFDDEEFLRLIKDPQVFKFCFVRDPFSRVLSCYLDKMVDNTWERNRLAPKLELSTDPIPTFLEFLEAIKEQKDAERDIHWMTQDFMLQTGTINYNFIGRFENFRSEFTQVCDSLGISEFLDLKATAHATNANNRLREYYGEREKHLVTQIYERDFVRFAYGWDIL